MNIEVVIDPYKIDRESPSLVIQSKDDYVITRLYIRDAVEKCEAIRVVIKNRGLNGWFKDLDRHAAFKSISPVEKLKSLLNRSDLPKILNQYPQKIVDLNLIKLAYSNPIKPGQSSLDWILEVTIKFPWLRENLKEGGDVAQVLEWLVKNRSPKLDNVLMQLCIEKIKVWKTRSPFREFLEWLESNPFERGYLFCLCQVIQNYPESHKAKWLQSDGQWSTICQLPSYTRWLNEIPVINSIDISPSLSTGIKVYIQGKLNQDGLTAGIVRELSGMLKIEEITFYRHLENPRVNKSSLPSDVMIALQDKFKEGELKDLLQKLKPVDSPPAIIDDSKIEDIIKWLQKHYFPYRYWCRTVDKEYLLDVPIANFEDWFIKNYKNLLSSHPEIFICSTRKNIHSLIQEGTTVLLVIIDGLAWQWVDYLLDTAKSKGFYLEIEPEMRFSMVPSTSEISKPYIISGLNLSDIMKSPALSLDYYNQLFKEAYGKFIGNFVVATDSTDTLLNLLREESKVYLYLFNEIDGIAHNNNNDTLRNSNIKSALDKLLFNLQCAVQEYERLHESKLKVVMVGDHGYLALPKHFTKLYADDSIQSSHGRVAEGKEIDGTYSLKLYNETYFLAKGFNVIGKKPRGCVHGGLTPDELVVPFIIFSTTSPEQVLKPSLALEGEIKRHYEECQFEIEITNPNPYKLYVSGIEIDFVKLIDIFPIDIPSRAIKRLKGVLDASNIDDTEVILMYQVKSTCLGQDNNITGTITLKTKGAALVDKAFEEEFDV